MNSSAESQGRNSKFPAWRSSLAGVLLAVAFIYVWIVPLFRPRGDFLWGHYSLRDIYIGIPIALATLCFVIILAVPERYKRPVSLRLVTVSITLLLALAIVDVVYTFGVMGVLKPNYWLDQAHIPRRYSAADNELGFVRKPLVSWHGYVADANRMVEYRTDSYGFRNSKEQGHADIVFIGDSFTESATVAEEDTFVRRVARSTGLSAVNLGRGAYGPQQELIVLERYGLAYGPRYVVWQLFEGNDLGDAETFARWKKDPDQVVTSLKDRYLENSLLNQWLTNTRAHEIVGPMATLRYHDGTTRRVGIRYPYEPDQPSTMHLGMTETLRAIEAGQQLCESRGIELLVVVIPTMVRAMAPQISFDRVEDQKTYLPEFGAEQKDFSRTIEEMCDRAGCKFVDAFDAFRETAVKDTRDIYIPNNEHLDIAGHDAMAKIVEHWIRSKDIAPSE